MAADKPDYACTVYTQSIHGHFRCGGLELSWQAEYMTLISVEAK